MTETQDRSDNPMTFDKAVEYLSKLQSSSPMRFRGIRKDVLGALEKVVGGYDPNIDPEELLEEVDRRKTVADEQRRIMREVTPVISEEFYERVKRLRSIRKESNQQFTQAILKIRAVKEDKNHPERKTLYNGWTDKDLESLLLYALTYEKELL